MKTQQFFQAGHEVASEHRQEAPVADEVARVLNR